MSNFLGFFPESILQVTLVSDSTTAFIKKIDYQYINFSILSFPNTLNSRNRKIFSSYPWGLRGAVEMYIDYEVSEYWIPVKNFENVFFNWKTEHSLHGTLRGPKLVTTPSSDICERHRLVAWYQNEWWPTHNIGLRLLLVVNGGGGTSQASWDVNGSIRVSRSLIFKDWITPIFKVSFKSW